MLVRTANFEMYRSQRLGGDCLSSLTERNARIETNMRYLVSPGENLTRLPKVDLVLRVDFPTGGVKVVEWLGSSVVGKLEKPNRRPPPH